MSEISETESRARYVKGELDKLDPQGWPVKLKLFSTGGDTFHLNLTDTQLEAIKRILLTDNQESEDDHE